MAQPSHTTVGLLAALRTSTSPASRAAATFPHRLQQAHRTGPESLPKLIQQRTQRTVPAQHRNRQHIQRLGLSIGPHRPARLLGRQIHHRRHRQRHDHEHDQRNRVVRISNRGGMQRKNEVVIQQQRGPNRRSQRGHHPTEPGDRHDRDQEQQDPAGQIHAVRHMVEHRRQGRRNHRSRERPAPPIEPAPDSALRSATDPAVGPAAEPATPPACATRPPTITSVLPDRADDVPPENVPPHRCALLPDGLVPRPGARKPRRAGGPLRVHPLSTRRGPGASRAHRGRIPLPVRESIRPDQPGTGQMRMNTLIL